jgi:transketolase
MATITQDRVNELRRIGNEVRRQVIKAVNHAGAGHIGGPLSAADMLAALYFEVLNLDPARPGWEERDRFILSKGHSSIALNAVLALRGYFPVEELATFDAIDSRLQGHPDMSKLPGLDMSTGSLGQGLSPGVGMALGARYLGKGFRTWVMLGDGETQEGQVWEAAFVAARYGLDNLTAILDYNRLQQYGWPTSQGYNALPRLAPEERPRAKWEAFGWHVIECDGHDIPAFLDACGQARGTKGKPTIIIAHTVKGKGVSFMEDDFNWHAKPISEEELRAAMAELDER